MVPITRSTYAGCQGARGADSTSWMPRFWTCLVKSSPKILSSAGGRLPRASHQTANGDRRNHRRPLAQSERGGRLRNYRHSHRHAEIYLSDETSLDLKDRATEQDRNA